MNPVVIFLIAAAVLAAVIVSLSVKSIRPYQRGIVERFGRFQRVIGSGLNMVWPYFDAVYIVDMRENTLDIPPQGVITKDNVIMEVDALVYCQVTDPARSRYEIDNYILASTKLAQTVLRNVIGELTLDQLLASRDQVNARLRETMDRTTDKWGVRVNRIELQTINPPADIMAAMHQQMKAEREKRATVLEAEASKTASILRAEGQKAAAILESEGYAESTRLRADADKYRQVVAAEAEAFAINNVFGAIHDANPDEKLITLKYLEMLPKLAEGQGSKVFVPYEASGMIAALSTMIEGIGKSQPSGSRKP